MSSAFDSESRARELLNSTASFIGRRVRGDASAQNGEYAAFLSYSHSDTRIARWLHRAIETYGIPRDLAGTQGEHGIVPTRLRPVFRDEDELAGAAELGPRLETALAKARALIVICSPAAARSVWVDKEIRTFKRLYPDRPVLAVIALGSPDESFPEALRYAVRPDGELDRNQPAEPLAPDLGKLDRRAVKLKLIAGLAGVPYSALVRRDLRRRRRLLGALASAAVVIIALLSTLSVVAFSYAQIAVRERNAAEQSRLVAIRERNEAVAARYLAEKRTWLAQQAASQIRVFADEAQCPPSTAE